MNFQKSIGPTLTFIFGAILSIALFSQVRAWEQSAIRTLFESRARSVLVSLQTDIVRHHEVVNAIANLFYSSQQVTRDEFRSFVHDALASHSNIQGLSWNPLIKNSERREYTERAQEEGFENFQITELDPNGHKNRAAIRDEYVVVYYIEPHVGNEDALGFDIASHPGRLQAIQQARDTGKAVITERIKLVQRGEAGFGYLLLKPIYQRMNIPDSVVERRKLFTGLAVGVFKFSDLLPTMLEAEHPFDIDVWLSDLSAPVDKQFLHFFSFRKQQGFRPTLQDQRQAENGLHWRTTTNMLGREWSFLFAPSSGFFEVNRSWQAWVTLVVGLSFTTLMTLYLFASARHAVRLANAKEELLHQIAERRQAQEQLIRFSRVLEQSLNEIYIFDSETLRFVDANLGAQTNLGFSIEELRNLTPVDIKPEFTLASFAKKIEPLRFGVKEKIQFTTIHKRKDGTTYPVEVHLQHIAEKPPVFVAIVLDITERKKAEAEQQRLQRELLQAHKMESLGNLTGGIAHDFNNLLGIIMGYSGFAYNHCLGREDTKQAEYLTHVLKASKRASDLVAQMLTFSRNQVHEKKPVQLQPLVAENLALVRSTLPSSIEIKFEAEENLPAVLMDPVQMNQLMLNLVVNARDAMQGKGSITIRLGWLRVAGKECAACHKQVEGDWVALSIADTASGIRPEVLDRIFDPYFTTKEVGTGMGLSVVNSIMQSCGGHILVNTELNKGTTFQLLFPWIDEETKEAETKDRSSTELPHGRGEHVLVLDDEPDLASFMAELLESYEYRVTVSTSSTNALELFKENPNEFALVITDQTMPILTGVELVTAIRKIRADIPVILNTGFNEYVDSESASKMGIYYLEKPVRVDTLIEMVGRLLIKRGR